jgi:hypothetical protein
LFDKADKWSLEVKCTGKNMAAAALFGFAKLTLFDTANKWSLEVKFNDKNMAGAALFGFVVFGHWR